MPADTQSNGLARELKLRDVYTVATGATLSAGLFLLPGLAAVQAGPAIVFCYVLAAALLVPAMLAVVELATAMPKAGGAYYFLDRSLGPVAGVVGGLGTWLALVLKTSFALVGIGAYTSLVIPDLNQNHMRLVACGFAVFFGVMNALGAKKTGHLQAFLVVGLLTVLGGFLAGGIPKINLAAFSGFFDAGAESILATVGLVYISYVGVTNVASISEEVQDPERNLPLGVFLSLGTSLLVYVLCTAVMVSVVPMSVLKGDLTPMATAAGEVLGSAGLWIITVGAFLAFFSVSNAGIMSSSRYPLAMSRDRLIPERFSRLSRNGTPVFSIATTVGVIIFLLVFLEPVKIAKLASAFQLMVFALLCLAVIVMRESGLDSYDPGYRAPFYPWVHAFGLVAPFVLIAQMGLMPTLFIAAVILVGAAWYFYYAASHVDRQGAIYHVFARLGEQRHEALDVELRSILKEKGLRDEDPFEEAVLASKVIDVEDVQGFDELIEAAARMISVQLSVPTETLVRGFTEGTSLGATPVAKGVALPHMRLEDIDHPVMVLVRVMHEIEMVTGDVFGNPHTQDKIHAVFFLVSPSDDPSQHLRMLAQLASRIDEDDFMHNWLAAENEVQLREVFLRDERYISLRLMPGSPQGALAGGMVLDAELPEECLIAAVRREGVTIIPRGNTVLRLGDRLLIIGDPAAITQLYEKYGQSSQV